MEEFKNCVSERTVVYLNEQKVATLQQAATLVDKFALTYKNVFAKRDSDKRDGDACVSRATVFSSVRS